MKLGIVVYSTDAETVWNGFRLGVFALKQGDAVKAFLLAKGVEWVGALPALDDEGSLRDGEGVRSRGDFLSEDSLVPVTTH